MILALVVGYVAMGQESGGTISIGAHYYLFDTTTGLVRETLLDNAVVDPSNPNSWKDAVADAIIADTLAALGVTLPKANIRFPALEPGDFRRPIFICDWCQAATLTNIGTSDINVYTGAIGLGQLAPFSSYTHYRFVAFGNKVGTGNLTVSLVNTLNAAQALTVTYTGSAGEFVQDSGWVALPSWAIGEELILKPMARSSVAADDPTFRQFLLYLK